MPSSGTMIVGRAPPAAFSSTIISGSNSGGGGFGSSFGGPGRKDSVGKQSRPEKNCVGNFDSLSSLCSPCPRRLRSPSGAQGAAEELAEEEFGTTAAAPHHSPHLFLRPQRRLRPRHRRRLRISLLPRRLARSRPPRSSSGTSRVSTASSSLIFALELYTLNFNRFKWKISR